MSNTLAFTITIDGQESTSEVEVTFDASRYSLKELVRVEQVIGTERAELFLQRNLTFTPSAIQALIWAKLATQYPEVGLNDFDIPGEAFSTTAEVTEMTG